MGLKELLGVEVERAGDGTALVGLVVHDGHLNVAGVVHGGVISTLIDFAIGLSVRSVLEPGSALSTAALNIAFLRPCRATRVRAEGRVVSRGRRLVFGEARVLADETLVAQGSGTWYVTPPEFA